MKQTWEEWMEQVNAQVSSLALGLIASDLPDQPWYEWYEDGVRPKTAAKRALKDSGWPG